MKTNQVNKISNIIDSTQSSEQKIKTIQSLIKQLCTPDNTDCFESALIKQAIVQKKIGASQETVSVVEKTFKIKKNKKKKKKKSNSLPAQLQAEKVFSHELCTCCSKKLDNDPTIDQYQSDQEDSLQDPADINSTFTSLGEDLLEYFYDEIDKIITRLMKDAESQHARTFVRLMKKLAQIFQDFDLSLRQQIQKELEDETFMIPMAASESVSEQFKTYIITKFPLLKDFIENFNLKQLDQKQTEQFAKIRSKSALIQSLYIHMEDIMSKRNKKKKKRQLQKLNKKNASIPSTTLNNELSLIINSSTEIGQIMERFSLLNINQKQRTKCYFDGDRFIKMKEELKNT